MRTTTFRTIVIGAVAALGLLVVACGGDDARGSSGGGSGQPPATDKGVASSNTLSITDPTSRDSVAPNSAINEQKATGATAAPGTESAYAPSPSGGEAPALASTLDRKIIFNATIDLSVKDVPTAYNAVSRAAKGAGGFVEKSSFLNAADDGARSATLTLRVPVSSYEDVLGELRTLDGVKVQREGSKSSEVTEQYTDLQSRLRNLQSTEAQYLKLLEQAKTINEILTVNDRINSVRSQIEQIQGRLKVLDGLTDMATIDVTIAPIVALKAGKQEGPKSVGEAFADAWEGSLEVVRYLSAAGAVAAVALIWLAVPAGLALLGARHARRNRPGAVAP